MTIRAAATFLSVLLGSLAAAGCASGVSTPAAAVDETAEFAPVSYKEVCLLENAEVKSPRLVEAIESGFKKAGAKVTRLRSGAGPMACPFVVTYEVPSSSGLINSIRFQTFEHGIPRVDAKGSAPEGRSLTVQAAQAYAAELLARVAHQKVQANAEVNAAQ